MARTRMLLRSVLLALFAAVTVGGSMTPATPAAAEDRDSQACYPGCSQPACDKSCGGPGTGVCERCACWCLM